MQVKKWGLFAFGIFCAQLLWAHALWIETNAIGQKNQSHEIRIYFGEYADKDISEADKWFSDLKDFTLIVTTPDGKSETLSATASGDCYKSNFTPKNDGVYTVTLYHPVKDFYHGMKLHYNSSATIKVGKSETGNSPSANKNQLSIFNKDATTSKKDGDITLVILFDGKPAAGKEVKIFAPNGWGKTLYSDENGNVSFKPLWEGQYQAEFTHTDETPGETEGKKYDKIFNAATYMILVK